MSLDTIYRFVTIAEACELLGISDRHVRELLSTGEIPAWRPSAQTVRIPYWVLVHRVSHECGLELTTGEAPGTITPSSSNV